MVGNTVMLTELFKISGLKPFTDTHTVNCKHHGVIVPSDFVCGSCQ